MRIHSIELKCVGKLHSIELTCVRTLHSIELTCVRTLHSIELKCVGKLHADSKLFSLKEVYNSKEVQSLLVSISFHEEPWLRGEVDFERDNGCDPLPSLEAEEASVRT